jgi:hypothetical protein
MAQYDLYNIESRLQQYDERVLRIDFDNRNGKHQIICWDPHFYEEYIAMTVPAGQLDARVERRMMEINPKHYNALEDIDQSLAEKERAEDSKIEDMARDMADNLESSFRLKPSRSVD